MTNDHMIDPKDPRSSAIVHRSFDKKIDPEDPFELNGHAVTVSPEEAEACMIEMTDTVIAEFSSLGWPPEMIFKMFKKPFYRMPFMIAQTRGDAFIQDRIERYFSRRIRR